MNRLRLIGLTAACVVAAGMACAPSPLRVTTPTSPVPPTPPRLEFLAAQVMASNAVRPASATDRSTLFGSVSGLVRDARSGQYLAVIDDRQPSRVAWLDVHYADGQLTVTPSRVVPLSPGAGLDARRIVGADLEAVVQLTDGSFVASEEGHISRGQPGQPGAGVWPPALIAFTPDIVVTTLVEWPVMFDVGPDAPGIRDNQGVESLALTPSGRLVAGLEQPRRGDAPSGERRGRPFSDGRGGPGRLIEFIPDGTSWRVARQWGYPIEPTPRRDGFPDICDDGENGLVDLLALTDTTFLSLERACLTAPSSSRGRDVINLYFVDIADAEDVAAVERLDATHMRGVRKTHVLDFDALIPRLPPELSQLENFEALAFGPPLPDGTRTLLFATDDNFRPSQSMAFVLMAIRQS